MTIEEARAELAQMVDSGAAPCLSDADLTTALAMSRVPDDDGRPPSDPDWEGAWDLHWAAAECMIIRHNKQAMAGGITEFTSEGANFKKARPFWLGQADWWRSQSPRYTGSAGIGIIDVTHEPPLIKPRSAKEWRRPDCDLDWS